MGRERDGVRAEMRERERGREEDRQTERESLYCEIF